MTRITVIVAGIAGLSASCYLAKAGFDVTVFEKNSSAGGRVRQFEAAGFRFDMGPSWYWMPDVFERFFNNFIKTPSDFYSLQRLDPSYRIIFGNYFSGINNEQWNVVVKTDIENSIESDFKQALRGIKQLPRSTRLGVYVAYMYYRSLFRKIKNTSAELGLKQRIRIPNSGKGNIARIFLCKTST